MAKILGVFELFSEVENIRANKTVGLITGCFDVLHVGHINLFRFAKDHVDILIVAIDNDSSIQKSKGITRPMIPQDKRSEILSELISIDYVVLLDNSDEFNSSLTNDYHYNLVERLRPNYVITNKNVDKYWRQKKKRVKSTGGDILLFDGSAEYSSTAIISKITNSVRKEDEGNYFYFIPL